ncbi:MAG: hypothetical protein DSZ12_02070 [Sulfurovum sp.]|nr:MAG: hypothetical protein DSZ12_02070 [Sulfurovum sp.]
MDKTYFTNTNIKQQKGFALMITLSVLMVLISLTMVLLGYFKKVQHDAKDTTAMIQADVYYADITDTFGRFKNKKTLFSTLYLFPVSLRSPDGRFEMYLRCQALSRGVNINWLGMEEKQNMREAYSFAQTVFDTVAQDYNIEDASRLLEMLLEEIGGKKQFVKKEYSRLRQKNGIISYKQFAQIVSNYQMEVDDTKVSRIPWRKYFTFSKDAKVIDAEYSSAELISLLFDVDVQSVKEWQSDPERSSLQAFVRENSGDYAARKKIIAGNTFLAESECTVAYKSSAEQYKFRFEYIQGEAKHFEFYKKN